MAMRIHSVRFYLGSSFNGEGECLDPRKLLKNVEKHLGLFAIPDASVRETFLKTYKTRAEEKEGKKNTAAAKNDERKQMLAGVGWRCRLIGIAALPIVFVFGCGAEILFQVLQK